MPVTEPITKAGKWLVDRSRWDDGMRGFFVRINATAGPEDMLVHVLAIEEEARQQIIVQRDELLDELTVEWEQKVIEARHLAAAKVYACRVKSRVRRDENDWQKGFRQGWNEAIAAAKAAIEENP
jgi:hypothetical protein